MQLNHLGQYKNHHYQLTRMAGKNTVLIEIKNKGGKPVGLSEQIELYGDDVLAKAEELAKKKIDNLPRS